MNHRSLTTRLAAAACLGAIGVLLAAGVAVRASSGGDDGRTDRVLLTAASATSTPDKPSSRAQAIADLATRLGVEVSADLSTPGDAESTPAWLTVTVQGGEQTPESAALSLFRVQVLIGDLLDAGLIDSQTTRGYTADVHFDGGTGRKKDYQPLVSGMVRFQHFATPTAAESRAQIQAAVAAAGGTLTNLTFLDGLQPVPVLDVRLASPDDWANKGFDDLIDKGSYEGIALIVRQEDGRLAYVKTGSMRLGLGMALFADEYVPAT